jgi:hypothetical protein
MRHGSFDPDCGRAKTRNAALTLVVLAAGWLAGCASAPVYAPPRRDNFYIEKETYRPRKPKPPGTGAPTSTPASAPAAEAAPAAGPAQPPGQLPAAAQSPTVVPPAGGLPHDSSQYIEPPPR